MYKIRKLNRSDTDFYAMMGPIFGSRVIAKEVGINIYDDYEKKFFICQLGSDFSGMASVQGCVVSDCYTQPLDRRNGILSQLLEVILSDMNYAKATCTPLSRGVFEKAGFKPIKQLKNFTVMEYKKNA